MKAVLMTYRRDDDHLRLPDDFPELRAEVVWSPAEMAAAAGDAEILILNNRICTPELGAAIRANARALRWVQFISSGTERGRAMGLPDGVPVTNASGIKGDTIAEHAMTLLLAFWRRIPDMVAARRAGKWIRLDVHGRMTGAVGKTLAVLGMGMIGHEVARRAKAFGMTVVGVSRAGTAGGDFDEVVPRTRLADALARADAVVVCLPSDAETFHMIGRAEFAAMKPGAVIVNVARGEILDQRALTDALAAGTLGGAALDVTDPEPPAGDSPLWTLDNVLISPHVSGGGAEGYPRFRKLFEENLRRFRAGEPLLGLVAGPPCAPEAGVGAERART